MKKKYLTYSLEELIDDKQFIAWVLQGNNSIEWERFIKNNPEFSIKAKKASELILLVCDKYEILDEESVLKMWQSIDRFDQKHKKRIRMIKIRRSFSWAASVLLVFSLGTLAYYKLVLIDNNYQFVSTKITEQSSEARLFLLDGAEIVLNSKNSTIELSNNELVINNDSVIDLSQKVIDTDKKLQMNEVIIPYGKRSQLLLADGTKVWLNAGSRLAFPSKFTKKTREVYLEGEACFEVAKNEEQPFIVNVAEINIKVLGTYFNVSAYTEDENIETVLFEGSVAVSNPKSFGIGRNEVVLKPNQKARFNKDNNSINVADEPNADIHISWINGWFQFSQESLPSVLNKLERYYNVEITMPENLTFSELITGKLDLKESLEEVLIALCDLEKIEYRIDGNKIFINKN